MVSLSWETITTNGRVEWVENTEAIGGRGRRKVLLSSTIMLAQLLAQGIASECRRVLGLVVRDLPDGLDWLRGLGTWLGYPTRTRNASWQGKRHPVRNLVSGLGLGLGLVVTCARSGNRSVRDGVGLVLLGLIILSLQVTTLVSWIPFPIVKIGRSRVTRPEMHR